MRFLAQHVTRQILDVRCNACVVCRVPIVTVNVCVTHVHETMFPFVLTCDASAMKETAQWILPPGLKVELEAQHFLGAFKVGGV